MDDDWTASWLALLRDQLADWPAGDTPATRRRLVEGQSWQRSGRLTDLRVEPGRLSGRVQGERSTPQLVEVRVATLDAAGWQQAIDVLAAQVRHTAQLLAGHAAPALDAELVAAGARIPPGLDELSVGCGCHAPQPCAHLAAVWEAFAERLGEDPFALFALRGRGRQRLLADVAARRAGQAVGAAEEGPSTPLDALDPRGWGRARLPLDALALPEPAAASTLAASLRLRGDPPGWAGSVGAVELFEPMIEAAAAWARAQEQ